MKHNKYDSAMGTGASGKDISGPTAGNGSLDSAPYNQHKQPIGPNTIPIEYNKPDPPLLKRNAMKNAVGSLQKSPAKVSGSKAKTSRNKMSAASNKKVVGSY